MAERLQNEEEKRNHIKILFDDMPEGLETRLAAASDVKHLFMEELAKAVLPAINAIGASRPQERLMEKQDISTEINALLHAVGLAIKCPRTNRPAILVADLKDSYHADISRFRFESRDEVGRKVRVGAYRTLPDLELMPDPPRREGTSRASRLNRKSGDDGPAR